MNRKFFVCLLFLFALLPAAAQEAMVRSLDADGVARLVAPPDHGRRIVMLWALACRYCEPNMERLARIQERNPGQVQLVLVATDPVSEAARISARLQAAAMSHYPAWAYAAAVPARLNHLVDPQWGGELPRTLVIDADGSRFAFSGLLTDKQLQRIAP